MEMPSQRLVVTSGAWKMGLGCRCPIASGKMVDDTQTVTQHLQGSEITQGPCLKAVPGVHMLSLSGWPWVHYCFSIKIYLFI